MIKKVLLVIFNCMLLACNEASPVEDAKAFCDCVKRASDMSVDDPNHLNELGKCASIELRASKKYKGDSKREAEYLKALSECETK